MVVGLGITLELARTGIMTTTVGITRMEIPEKRRSIVVVVL